MFYFTITLMKAEYLDKIGEELNKKQTFYFYDNYNQSIIYKLSKQ